MNAVDAAAFLGISHQRLRQLVAEGKLDAMPLSNRFTAYPLVELERLKQVRDGGQASTAVAALMDEPVRPLRRTHNIVLRVHPAEGCAYPDFWLVHVRIWQGSDAAGLPRTVVLLTAADGTSPFLPGGRQWCEIADDVAERLLLGSEGDAAAWFTISMPDVAHYGGMFEVHNVVSYLAAKPSRMAFKSSLPPAPRYQSPTWRRSDLAELRRVTGSDPLELFPTFASTETTIESWARRRHCIDVIHDTTNLGGLLAALVTFVELPPENPHHALAQRAASQLAQQITFLEDMCDQLPAQDGAVHDQNEVRDYVMAARLIRRPFAAHERALVERHHHSPIASPWSWTPQAREEMQNLIDDLRGWRQTVDRFAAEPIPRIESAITTAENVLAYYLTEARKQQQYEAGDDVLIDSHVYPPATLRTFWVDGPVSRAYLDTLTPVATDLRDTHEYRELQDAVAKNAQRFSENPDGEAHGPASYGTDGTGRLVVTVQEPPNQSAKTRVTVLWPHDKPQLGLPDQAILVGERGPGDRTVYIQYPDGEIDLLPSDPAPRWGGWNFGYDGGGPGSLSAAIARAYALTHQIPLSRMPHAWIKDAVQHAPEDQFLLRIADITRRVS